MPAAGMRGMDVLYFDNVIASGRIRGDLKPPAEMAAVRSIEAAEKAGLVKITTARIAFEEQDRTNNLAVREQLKRERPGRRSYRRPSGCRLPQPR
jgi:hypothetical protein